MRFEFATSTRILFGSSALSEIGPIATQLGRRALVVAGKSGDRAAPLLDALERERIEHGTFSVPSEPTTDLAVRGTEIARSADCDLVIAIGGGSALDTGRAIAALLTNDGHPLDYLEGLRRAGRSLLQAYTNGNDDVAREDMAVTSLFGGLALANAGLGAVHGLTGPIGGMFSAPHGAVCASLLPHVMAVNVEALRRLSPSTEMPGRYEEISRVLTGDQLATPEDGIVWVSEICRKLNTAPLSSYGFTENEFPELIEKATTASSMKGNPVELTYDDMREILMRAL